MKTFKDLLENNEEKFKDVDSDLLELFERHYEDDEVEELNDYDVRDTLDYEGSLHELIDGKIDIYNYDLRQWAVDNYEYVEQAVDEGLVDTSDFDFHGAIQAGQYVYYQEQMSEELERLVGLINEEVKL